MGFCRWEQTKGTLRKFCSQGYNDQYKMGNLCGMDRSQEYSISEWKDKPITVNRSDSTVLSKWLTLYTTETKKQNGTWYPSKTPYLLLPGFLRHIRTLNPFCSNFLDNVILYGCEQSIYIWV